MPIVAQDAASVTPRQALRESLLFRSDRVDMVVGGGSSKRRETLHRGASVMMRSRDLDSSANASSLEESPLPISPKSPNSNSPKSPECNSPVGAPYGSKSKRTSRADANGAGTAPRDLIPAKKNVSSRPNLSASANAVSNYQSVDMVADVQSDLGRYGMNREGSLAAIAMPGETFSQVEEGDTLKMVQQKDESDEGNSQQSSDESSLVESRPSISNLTPQKKSDTFNLNERYQSALEAMEATDMKAKNNFEVQLGILSEIVEISQSFISTALIYGRIIISEAFLPEELRTVKPTKSGGQLVISFSLFFRSFFIFFFQP